jgi:Concanavalin A-like lectin/glucanases superfamily
MKVTLWVLCGVAALCLWGNAQAAVNPDYQWHDGYYTEQDDNTVVLFNFDEEDVQGSYHYSPNEVEYGAPAMVYPNATWLTAGKFGKAYSFAGPFTSNSKLQMNWYYETRRTDAFTVEAWVYPTSVPTDGDQVIYHALYNYELWYLPENSTMNFYFGEEGGGYNASISVDGIPTNEWTHVAVTYESSTGKMSMYINGVQKARKNYPGAVPFGVQIASYIGNANSGSTYTFKGLIDDVRISRVARKFVAVDSEIVSTASIEFAGSGAKISWISETGATYDIQYKDAGGTWTNMGLSITGTGDTLSYIDTGDPVSGRKAPALDSEREYRVIKQ